MAGALAAYKPYGKYAAVRAPRSGHRGQGNAVRAMRSEPGTPKNVPIPNPQGLSAQGACAIFLFVITVPE